MSTFSGYTTKTFSPTQKFFVLDPNTGTPSFVQGSDLVAQLTPNSSYVFAESTRTTAQATDYELGKVIQTGGATSIGDGQAGVYLVVAAGAGDFPMDNGLELLTLAGDDTLLERLALNTVGEGSDLVAHTGTSDTVTEALDKRTIYVGSVAEGFAGLGGLADAVYKSVAWHPGGSAQVDPKGGGHFTFKSGVSKSAHNGITIISPTVPAVSAQSGVTDSDRRDNFLSGAGETDAAGTGCFVLNLDSGESVSVFNAGAFGDDTRDDNGAFSACEAANLHIKEGAGTFLIEGDWKITTSNYSFEGSGADTHLHFNNGGLLFDASVLVSGFLEFLSFHNFQITRTGTAGPAMELRGQAGGGNPDVIRSNFSNIWIEGSTGSGIRVFASYLHTFHGFYIRNTELAWDMEGAVAISIVGGETQQNTKAGEWEGAGINIQGHTTEGNQQGHELIGDTRAFTYSGGYFEANSTGSLSGYDFKIGSTGSPQCRCVEISGNLIAAPAGTRTSGIYWVNATASSAFGNTYSGFDYPHNMSLAEDVDNCSVKGEQYGLAVDWVDAHTLGFANSYRLVRDDTSVFVKSLDFPNLAAGGTSQRDITDVPCSPGDRVSINLPASVSANPELDFYVFIPATDTIRVVEYNRSAAAIDLPVSNFVIELTRI